MEATSVLSDLAKAEIDELAKDGIIPTAAEIVKINYLACRVETPEARMHLARGRPVFVGKVALWPLTMRAISWLDLNLRGLDKFTRACALGYAMCYGHSEGSELDIPADAIPGVVKAWFLNLRCTRKQYDEAIKQVDAQDRQLEQPKNPNGKPMTLGDFSAFLVSIAGGTPDFWERRCAMGYCVASLNMRLVQNNADGKASAFDPFIVANRALGWYTDRLRKKYLVKL